MSILRQYIWQDRDLIKDQLQRLMAHGKCKLSNWIPDLPKMEIQTIVEREGENFLVLFSQFYFSSQLQSG